MNARRKRCIGLALLVTVLLAISCGVPAIRRSILREAGWALVADDPIESVDIIVISIDADGVGALEAADLVQRGVATRVAVIADPSTWVSEEFARRGIPYEDGAARSVRQLKALGVESVETIPQTARGTTDEGQVLAGWCDRLGIHSFLIVSTSDHSRRLRRVLHRSMKGQHIRTIVRGSRYTHFDPDRWWKSRSGIRTEIEESEKLFLDVLLHPIS